MSIKWRNCKTDTPSEDESKLFLTDGEKIYAISYSKTEGFFDDYVKRALPKSWLDKLWWTRGEWWIETPTGWVKLCNVQEVQYDREIFNN